MGPRRAGRIIAVQALYAWDISRVLPGELLEFSWLDGEELENFDEVTKAFAVHLIAGTIKNIQEIDESIQKRLEHWDFNRVSKVDLAILRMSVYCFLYVEDIPPSVVIDEAVDISKEFGSDDSYRFINGVLDGIRKNKEQIK
jgi:N utilization substance protein B